MNENKGKLIVIEGCDGSGKTTQFNLLKERLEKEDKNIETIKFPQHGQTFFGKMVDDYLNNKFGQAAELHPYIASFLYAADRWQAKEKMSLWLDNGSILLLDRYMTANKGHQVGKLKTDEEKIKCLEWLDEMEYEVFGIPRPDVVFYLDMPAEFNLKLLGSRNNDGKEYIEGDLDGHENLDHLQQACDAFRFTTNRYKYWKQVDCVENNELLSPEQIHEKIWRALKNDSLI